MNPIKNKQKLIFLLTSMFYIYYIYLILPERSPEAKCAPSGLIRIALTPFRLSYVKDISLSIKFTSVFFIKFNSGSI